MSAPLGFDRASIDALGWTLLHFVWQGVLIAMAFAGVDRLLSRGSANLRYLVACGTLLVMLMVPIGTFVVVRGAGTPGITGLGASMLAPRAATNAIATHRTTAGTKAGAPATPGPDGTGVQPTRTTSVGRVAREAFAGWDMSAQLAAAFPWLVLAWGMG